MIVVFHREAALPVGAMIVVVLRARTAAAFVATIVTRDRHDRRGRGSEASTAWGPSARYLRGMHAR